jgi:beta-mannosidase
MQLLNGKWKIKSDPNGEGDEREWFRPEHSDKDWFDIKVPSHWQEEILPNYEGIAWYRCQFDLSEKFKNEQGPRILLRFDGIFYYSEIWLNNEYLGAHEGYFDKFEFDISDLLYDNNNIICVKVVCRDEKKINRKKQITGVFSHWDASDPNFNPGGIWNDVQLIKKQTLYIRDFSISTKLDEKIPNRALIDLKFNIDSLITSESNITFDIKPRNFQSDGISETTSMELKPGNNILEKRIIIHNARLWWTYDHGLPNLYDLKITAIINGRGIETFETPFGIKEIELKRENGWQFYLNKKRIFIRGSNYAPQDLRIANSTRDDYEEDVDLMVDANFNMIRVHAHIDRKELHEVTSEKGILIYQDFPLQWSYDKSIFKPAKKQTKKIVEELKNYPSQAVWCCHNEPFKLPTKREYYLILGILAISTVLSLIIGYYFNFLGIFPVLTSYIISSIIGIGIFFLISTIVEAIPTAILVYNWNRNVLDKKLVELVKKLDPDHLVVKASGLVGKSDFHFYDGWYFNPGKYWKARKFANRLLKMMVPFVTEYGAQSFPKIQNFKKFKIENEWPFSENTWDILKDDYRCQYNIFRKIFKINEYKSLEDFINATQEYQAELLKFHNELWRKMRFNKVGGAICFLFNDCAPLISWSIIDYWREPKKAYDAVKLSFEPLYPFLNNWPRKYAKNSLFKNKLLLINDYLEKIEDIEINITVKKSKNIIYEKKFSVNIDPDSILEVDKIEFQIPGEQGRYNLEILLNHEETTIKNNYYFDVK